MTRPVLPRFYLPRLAGLATGLISAATLSLPALAHQPDLPAEIPPAYLSECGNCHVAYPPSLLPEAEWRQVMQHLDKHYGDNASLDEATRALLEQFLTANAGQRWRGLFGSGEPPRITNTAWYRVHHLALPDAILQDRRVRSRANCAACHPKAERGLFNKHDLTEIPAEYHVNQPRPPLIDP